MLGFTSLAQSARLPHLLVVLFVLASLSTVAMTQGAAGIANFQNRSQKPRLLVLTDIGGRRIVITIGDQ
jgi:hypothetical protein